ncbi:MAG: putative DNA binding domain-containing protein [Micrococcales bacterium]|nr:putative DNA binding domain-containing protein [Micrococcales bacterium]
MRIRASVDTEPTRFETSAGLLSDMVDLVRAAGTDLARIEVKAAVGGMPKSVWETVSAFANTSGGVVVLGLSEKDGFAPAGGFDAAAIRDQVISGLEDRSHPKVSPAVPYTIDIAMVDDAPVVVADIAPLPGIQRPSFVVAQGVVNGSYRRLGDGDRRMSAFEVFMHQTNRAQPTDDRAAVEGASVDDLNPDAVDAYLRRLRAQGRAALDDQPTKAEALERMVAVDEGQPTLAGLLTLGLFPQRWFPQLTVTVAVFPTIDGTEITDGVRLVDNQTIDGPAPRIIMRTVEAMGRNLARRVLSNGMGGQQSWEIPEGVLREAVTNAVMHRDYSPFSLGSQVRVEIFPDRIEVHNPGGVWGGQSVDDLLRGGSHSRNAVLANLLADVELEGSRESLAENKGTGLRRMVGLMRKAGLHDPEFVDRVTEFVVILRRTTIATPQTIADSTDLRWDAILKVLSRASSPLRATDLAGIEGMSKRQVDRALATLITQGRVEATAPPRSKNRAYRLASGLRKVPSEI